MGDPIRHPGVRVWAGAPKRACDILAGLLLLLVAAALLPLVAVAIRLEGRGSLFFRQERLGKDGVPFVMWKLRTMRADAVPPAAPERKRRDDPRVTRVGRWLRRASLDELPQTWNVLRGEMSLVGPRPLTAAETESLGPLARRRLAVRPGLTGLWQVSGRSDLPPERLLELDLAYAARCSLWLDLQIVARTVPAVLAGWGAYAIGCCAMRTSAL
ncbi:MAG: sugar transferase [Armatimonadetes bacterium]|nr:sugar transferase [Armatimonadota bacterium]